MPREATEPPRVNPEYLQPIVDDLWKKGIRQTNNLWKFRCRLVECEWGWDVVNDGETKKVELGKSVEMTDPKDLKFWWVGYRGGLGGEDLRDFPANFVDYPEPPREPWVERDDSRWKALIKRESEHQGGRRGYDLMLREAWKTLMDSKFPEQGMLLEDLEDDFRALQPDGTDAVRDMRIHCAKQMIGAWREFWSRLERTRWRTTITGSIDGHFFYPGDIMEPERLCEEIFLFAACVGAHNERFINAPALCRGYGADSGRGGSKKTRPSWLPDAAKAAGFPRTPKAFFKTYKGNAIAKKGKDLADGIYYVRSGEEESKVNKVDSCGKRLRKPLALMDDDDLREAKIKRRETNRVTLTTWLVGIASEQSD